MRKKLIAGNWKMFKTIEESVDFAMEIKLIAINSDVGVLICPPYTSILTLKEQLRGTSIKIGAQNMHFEDQGAFTGEISAKMLAEIGVEYCIIGHSERREYFNETDETVNLKLFKALSNNIIAIICVGENLIQRESNLAEEIVESQLVKDLAGVPISELKNIVIAYEPIWAIGTGITATNEQANEMVGFIRKIIKKLYSKEASEEIIILYGGSVKAENATALLNMSEIDGALVGGASLNAEDFCKIINY